MYCAVCKRTPIEIDEYKEVEEFGCTPNEYVRNEEGTYNPEFDIFYCTECYIKIGQPLGKAKFYVE